MAFAAVTILMDTLNQNFLQPKPRLTLRNKRKVAALYRNLCFFQTSLEEHAKQVCKYDDEEVKSLEAQLRDVSVELRFQIERQLSLFYLGRSMKLKLESAQQLLPILNRANRAIKQGLETADGDLWAILLVKHLMLPVSRMPVPADVKQLSDILVEAKNLITQELMRTSYHKEYMKQRIKALQRLRQIFSFGIKLTNPMKKKVSLKVKDANDHSKNNAQKHNTSHSLGVLECHRKVAVGASLQHTTKMVGRDDEFKTIMDKLKQNSKEREIVPIVGMGGIGKTTMARRIYDDESMISHFEVFQDLLRSLSPEKKEIDKVTTDKLRELVQKFLKGPRYFIVIDDIWSTGVWDNLKQCFPDENNGSRVLLTSRLKNVAEYASSSSNFHPNMRFLNSEESWNLFYNKVSKRITFTTDFETISREIVDKCKGLPLAISVAAGLLSNSSQTLNEWEHIAKNVSTLSLDHSEEQCGNIINLSYTSLPHHLKPCFLSLGVFPEDHKCDAEEIIDLWISEGFLKVESCKSLDDVARECMQDLVDRNLVQTSWRGAIRPTKTYMMHDVLRELAIREAERENYLYRKEDDAIRLEHKRIQSIHCCPPKAQQGTIRSRTCLNDFSIFPSLLWIPAFRLWRIPSSILVNANFKLLRVLKMEFTKIRNPIVLSEIMGLVHLRCLTLGTDIPPHLLPLFMLWNLKKLDIYGAEGDLGTQIPPQLMYLRLDRVKLVPPKSVQYNLESVEYLDCMSCTRELFLMIPNLKKLVVLVPYDIEECREYWFESLVYLHKLQELKIRGKILGFGTIHSMGISSPESFLPNLKKLTLIGTELEWKDMDVVGTLPKLEDLILDSYDAVRGPKWEPREGGFRRLKSLYIYKLELRYWEATSDHFPVLEHLALFGCSNLEDIPRGFADIGTLQSIELVLCSNSAMNSAKYIEEEMKEFGNDDFVLLGQLIYFF